MTIRSCSRSQGRPRAFVPVYIGYERVMEGQTYVRELAGRPKQRESLWQLVKSIRSIRRVFGRVHVNFGEPLPLAAFLDGRSGDWRVASATAGDEWLRTTTREAASELATRINDAAVINPVSLVALGPVSYTHLDVYKRQLFYNLLGAVGRYRRHIKENTPA